MFDRLWRFARHLPLQVFLLTFVSDLKTNDPNGRQTVNARNFARRERGDTRNSVTDGYEKAVEAIVDRVHRRKGKLVTSGMGKAGQIAMNIATTFSSTGTPAVYLHPSEAQHGDLGVVQPDDIVLFISNSGKTREILELVELLHGLYSDIPVLCNHRRSRQPLGAACRYNAAYGAGSRGVPARAYAYHFYHYDDGDRRRAGGKHDAGYRLHAAGICQTSPRRDISEWLLRTPQNRC